MYDDVAQEDDSQLRIYRNWRHIRTGISYKGHLAMAAKLLEIPPSVKGAVVECGCWLGGTTNLSIICDIVGRDLIVYDSFEGLPAPEALGDKKPHAKGGSREVSRGRSQERSKVRRYRPVQVPQGMVQGHAPQPH